MRVMPMLTEPAGERGPIPVRTAMRVSEAMPALPPGRAGRRIEDVPAFMGIVMRRDNRIFALPPIPQDRSVCAPSAAPATRRGESR